MENSTFKSSLFGGFKREDVIDYITKSANETQERIASLESDIDSFCRQEQQLRAQISTLTNERDALTAELEALREQYVQAQSALTSLSAERSALSADADALHREIAQLRPQVEEYASVKAHIAEIELEARHRCDALERSVREKLNTLVDTCCQQCSDVLSTLSETCAHVSGEMHRIDDAVNSLPTSFESLRGSLTQLDELKK